MVASDFDGLGGYRTLEYEGQVPTKPCSCCFSRVFQASACIATYGMSVPSLHTESTDSVIGRYIEIVLFYLNPLTGKCEQAKCGSAQCVVEDQTGYDTRHLQQINLVDLLHFSLSKLIIYVQVHRTAHAMHTDLTPGGEKHMRMESIYFPALFVNGPFSSGIKREH